MTEARIEWLARQIDADEAMANAAYGRTGRWWRRERDQTGYGQMGPSGALLEGEPEVDDPEHDIFIAQVVVYDEGRPSDAEFAHIARHDPARVLREVAAKQRIVDDYRISVNACRNVTGSGLDSPGYKSMCGGRDAFRAACVALAAVYSDRDGYAEHWGDHE